MKKKEAIRVTCTDCGIMYVETWDEGKCPHNPIGDLVTEVVKVLSGGKSKYVKKNG